MIYDILNVNGKRQAVLVKRGKETNIKGPLRDTQEEAMRDGEVLMAKAQKHKPGTHPDTHVILGPKRRAWLLKQGGYGPTLCRLIDEAMNKR